MSKAINIIYSMISYVLGNSNDNKLVFDTFDITVKNNSNAMPIFHSDRSFQYNTKIFNKKLNSISTTKIRSLHIYIFSLICILFYDIIFYIYMLKKILTI